MACMVSLFDFFFQTGLFFDGRFCISACSAFHLFTICSFPVLKVNKSINEIFSILSKNSKAPPLLRNPVKQVIFSDR